ncbi:hypothetical protein [Nocardia sp. R6R-6]|uniref:hypothetical protein n=1 Tax=Nocardia sp. R6R-6 TaxID=3459303 RepID=UPI00403DE622
MNIAQGTGEPVLRSASLDDLAEIAALEQTEFGELAYPYFALRQLFDLHGTHLLPRRRARLSAVPAR